MDAVLSRGATFSCRGCRGDARAPRAFTSWLWEGCWRTDAAVEKPRSFSRSPPEHLNEVWFVLPKVESLERATCSDGQMHRGDTETEHQKIFDRLQKRTLLSVLLYELGGSEVRRVGRLDQMSSSWVFDPGQQVVVPRCSHHAGHLGGFKGQNRRLHCFSVVWQTVFTKWSPDYFRKINLKEHKNILFHCSCGILFRPQSFSPLLHWL